ncbi:glutamine amidotransferase [Myxococcota bacterium]|nr:glutamine amidotransferase [Myxococcota bacterium]
MTAPGHTRLLVVKTGDALPSVRARYGDFDGMFLRALGELAIEARVVSVHTGDALPAPDDADAILVTGSPSSVTALEPWADALATWLRRAVDAERPLLGVCYGHQLLAHALGGRVDVNPRGYEVGTIDVELLDAARADPLLGFVARGARTIEVMSTHHDAVVELPPGATWLAKTDDTPVQAFAFGRRAWGVQFHPEFTDAIMQLYAAGRADAIRKSAALRGEDPEAALTRVRAGVRATPDGPRLLRRFIELTRPGHAEPLVI